MWPQSAEGKYYYYLNYVFNTLSFFISENECILSGGILAQLIFS